MAIRILVNEYYIQIMASSSDRLLHELVSNVRGIEKARAQDTYFCSLHKLPEVLSVAKKINSIEQLPLGKIRDLYEEELLRRNRTKMLKELGPDMTSDWLWPHQCLGIELAQVNRRYNFYYDTRTGKTLMCLRVLYDRLKSGKAKRCLVICPTNIIHSWLDDAKRYFPELKVVAFYGDAYKRNQALTQPAHVVLWATEHVAPNIDLLTSLHFHTCIFDESSKIKNYKTKIAEAARKLSLTIPSWYNLSATPAPNGEHEYYSQMMCLDPYVFSPARTHFVAAYFDNVSYSSKFEKLRLKPALRDQFMSIIEDYSLYVDQSVMPTAGKEWVVVPFHLSEEAMKLYNQMRANMAAEVEGVTITAEMSAAMRAKLNQIASGFIMDTEARKENATRRKIGEEESETEVYRLEDRSRITALSDILTNESGNKVVIWANYRAEFAMLKELLGDRARYIHGGTSIEDKELYIYEEFKRGALPYLVCHPLSVGMGINLTEAHVAVYYSLNDSWEAFKQSSERIYGHINTQPYKCKYYILQAVDTVNELIYKNLINKRDASTGFLEHLKGGAYD